MTAKDETEVGMTEKRYLSWGDLNEPLPPAERYIPDRDGWIKFKQRLAAHQLAEFQRRAGAGRRGESDPMVFVKMVMQEVMIQPPIHDEKDLQAMMTADASVVFGVLNAVVDPDTFRQIKEDLGEI